MSPAPVDTIDKINRVDDNQYIVISFKVGFMFNKIFSDKKLLSKVKLPKSTKKKRSRKSDQRKEVFSPLSLSYIRAGFPDLAENYIEKELDLNRYLVKNRAATFYMRVKGDSMINAGINDGDILVVSRAQNALDSSIVIASVDGKFTVKRLKVENGVQFLMPENPIYPPIRIREGMGFEIWGVVTHAIHEIRR